MNAKPAYFVGLDLGKTEDPSAIAVVERPPAPLRPGPWQGPASPGEKPAAPPEKPALLLRHLDRFKLGTSYAAVVDEVGQLLRTPELEGATLIADVTGVGLPCFDFMRQARLPATLRGVLITAGASVSCEGPIWHVAKVILASTLQLLFQTNRLHIAAGLREAPMLVKELQNFRVKVTPAANEIYEAWRTGQHDDMVLATAIACWWAENFGGGGGVEVVQIPSRIPERSPFGRTRDRSPGDARERGIGGGWHRSRGDGWRLV
jgi:hypothetical protein